MLGLGATGIGILGGCETIGLTGLACIGATGRDIIGLGAGSIGFGAIACTGKDLIPTGAASGGFSLTVTVGLITGAAAGVGAGVI